jgi:hypothetical protein
MFVRAKTLGRGANQVQSALTWWSVNQVQSNMELACLTHPSKYGSDMIDKPK